MDESGIYGELSTFVLNTLGLYGGGKVDPSRVNGMWCKHMVKKGRCTFKELNVYLKSIAKDVGDPDKFEYRMAPSASMKDDDIVAIIKDRIFHDKYDFYRRIKKKYPNS